MQFDFLNNYDFIFIILSFIYLLFFFNTLVNYKKKKYKKWYIKILLLRYLIFASLLLLLLNPILNFFSYINRDLKLGIFVDNSSSMKFHQQPTFMNFKSDLDNFFEKIKNKEIFYETFLFDRNVKSFDNINKLDGNGLTTNLSKVAKSIENNPNLHSALIITDGVATEGMNPIKSFEELKIPIFALGVGENSKMVDLSIQTIDVPTVSFINDNINLRSVVKSEGIYNKSATISLYQENDLIVSKDIFLNNTEALNEVDFLFKPKKIGNQKFEIRVSSFEDELNIQNNRQAFNILILKNKYKVALFTGTPNNNTYLIRENLKKNSRIEFDHYVKVTDSDFKPSINSFWGTSYELIIFENFPIKNQSFDFVRILGKKIIANNSAIFLIIGPNQKNESLKSISALLDFELNNNQKDTHLFNWSFKRTENFSSLPPISGPISIRTKNKNVDTLAFFENEDLLWFRNEKNKIRSVLFLSPELLKLKSKFLDYNPKPSDLILDNSITWLLQLSGSKESYFRLNKKRLRLGEVVNIAGNSLTGLPDVNESLIIKLSHNGNEIDIKEFDFNIDLKRWELEYRPPSSGLYDYKILFESEKNEIQIGEFEVLESKIELSNVYMNELLLKSISASSSADFSSWTMKDTLLLKLKPKSKKEIDSKFAKFNENIFVFITIVFLFCFEVFYRKNKGLL